MTKKKLPHGSILHALFDARKAGRRMVDLYDIEVSLGISGWDLRAAVEDLKNSGFCIENEDGIMISDAGFNEAKSRWA
jgi:hypothetical protein